MYGGEESPAEYREGLIGTATVLERDVGLIWFGVLERRFYFLLRYSYDITLHVSSFVQE